MIQSEAEPVGSASFLLRQYCFYAAQHLAVLRRDLMLRRFGQTTERDGLCLKRHRAGSRRRISPCNGSC